VQVPAEAVGDALVVRVLRLVTVAEVLTEAEEADLVTEDEVATELLPALLPQPKAMLLSCHVAVVEENPAQTKPVTALAFAPENCVRGMVMV
jgi:hypothetical protein